MSPPRARGVALISALLIAAVVASIAALLVSRAQYAIAGVTQLQRTAAAGRLTESLELQAMALLALDMQAGLVDSAMDNWASARLVAKGEGLEARATLEDLQGRFNLTNLSLNAVQSAQQRARQFAETAESAPGDEGTQGSSGPGADALRAVAASAGVDLHLPPSKPGAPQPALSQQQVDTVRFVLLLRALKIDPVIVPAILDWLDSDQETRFPNGAEDDYYLQQKPPYRTGDRRFDEASELLRVRGITPEIYAKLQPYVTVLAQATPINVNTAPPPVLMSLSPGIDESTATSLVNLRNAHPWQSVQEFVANPQFAALPVIPEGVAVGSGAFQLDTRIAGEELPVHYTSTLVRASQVEFHVTERSRRYGRH